jgi:hypothetical protein
LEFDIGFLLGTCLSSTAAPADIRTDDLRPLNRAFPVAANADPRSQRQFLLATNWLIMAFGMPEGKLSRRAAGRKSCKYGQLDILAFGMPKISVIF